MFQKMTPPPPVEITCRQVQQVRCSPPHNKDYKKWEKNNEEEIEKEEKIRKMRKERNQSRRQRDGKTSLQLREESQKKTPIKRQVGEDLKEGEEAQTDRHQRDNNQMAKPTNQ